MPNAKCLECRKKLHIPTYRVKSFRFCSRKCGWAYKDKHERVKVICKICSKTFSVISCRGKTAKFCSRPCYNKSLRGRGSVEHSCLHCQKKFWDSPCKLRKFCSKACVGKSNKDTWNPAFTTVRKAMDSRGQIKSCNRCGYSEEPRILGVHHKDRNRKNNKKTNLEVLCPNCHSLEHLKHIPQ